MFYLTTHSTHFIYSYMASDIWLRTILIVRKETRCCHIGYSYRLTARVLLYAPSHRQNNTYHSLCYTIRGALAGTRSMINKWSTKPQKATTNVHTNLPSLKIGRTEMFYLTTHSTHFNLRLYGMGHMAYLESWWQKLWCWWVGVAGFWNSVLPLALRQTLNRGRAVEVDQVPSRVCSIKP